MGNSRAKPLLDPFLGEKPFHGVENFFVLGVFAAVVPKPVDHQLLSGGSVTKSKAIMKVFFKRHRKIVGLESMKGNIDLVKGRGAQQHLLLLF